MAYIFPKKIFPNNLNSYLLCPFKFKCQNDREIKAEFIESPQTFVGKVVHMVLRNLFDIEKVLVNKRGSQDLATMVRYAWARMPKNGKNKGYWGKEDRRKVFGSEEQERAFGLNTISMISNYISSANLSATPMFLEDWMECSAGKFTIAGRVDRVDQDSKSSISVWDYKTGKLPFYKSMEKIIEKDIQIPMYAVISSKNNLFAKKIRAGFIYVKYSKVYEIVWSRDELKEVEEKIISIIKEAQNDKALLPRVNSLCGWCQYKDICPAKKSIEEKEKKVEDVSW